MNLLEQAKRKLGPQVKELVAEQTAPKNGVLPLSEIIVKETQVRDKDKMEDAENPLHELADAIKKRGVLQPILVRPIQGGKYELVCGERRYRASTLAGLTEIPVLVKVMTDEEVYEAQFIENIHRKNLTLQEQAARIQRDLEANGGNVQAVLERYNKKASGKAWISKMLSLLDLPEQAKRLISEDISADTEVILAVKRLEKIDPKKAEEVVEELKESRTKGQGVARKTVSAAKAEVDEAIGKRKPSKPKASDSGDSQKLEDESSASVEHPASEDRKQDEVRVTPQELEDFYLKGLSAASLYDELLEGIRQRQFDDTPVGHLRLLAFSKGYEKDDDFSVDTLLASLP